MNLTKFDFKKITLDLINKNGQTTSLEVKNTLRNLYPLNKFYQTEVSNDLNDLEQEGEISIIDDNGTYRTYGVPKQVIEVTTTEMAQILAEMENKVITIEYSNKKKETTTKVITVYGMNNLGYREIMEHLPNGLVPKQIDPKNVRKIIFSNTTYIKKK